MTARWVAAQRLRLEHTRPSTPAGDVHAEHTLYRDIAAVAELLKEGTIIRAAEQAVGPLL